MFEAIPEELKAIPQWVIWRYETTPTGRITKVPYSPNAQRFASVTNPHDWGTWFTANAALAASGYDGLGFVLTDNDPYTFIDLDDADGEPVATALQSEVYRRFQGTYSELSPSGKGLHIIVKGRVPTGKGKRRHSVEVYSTERYMTMTGNVHWNMVPADKQEEIDWLWQELGGGEEVSPIFEGTYQDTEPDQVILDRALNAVNGDRFRDLLEGRWDQHYPSQSEADFAFIDILAFYTSSIFQIVRIFRNSPLGQREKAQREDYVMKMVRRAFDRHPPPIDLSAMRAKMQEQLEAITRKPSEVKPYQGENFEASILPPVLDNPYLENVPGLLGQIAYYIYSIAPRPVPEIALASAIGLMAGITGRAFNVSGMGLNQYLMLLAGTGRGKESVHDGISRLMEWVSSVAQGGGGCPGAREFIGPGDIASGQALIKYMDAKSKSFVTVQGEIDLTLKSFTAKNANAAMLKLKQILLASYNRSGRGKVLEPMIYSDKDKNTGSILSPAITLLGEGTPERFFALLDEALVADGLLPRFTVIYYEGDRVPLNTANLNAPPPPYLVKSLATLCGQALSLNARNAVLDVKLDQEAQALLDDFNTRIDAIINAAHNDTIEQLWNRAHAKALKLAATVAVGCNFTSPIIDGLMARYAINLVSYDTHRLVARFQAGDIGDSESRQMNDLRRVIRKYLRSPREKAAEFGSTMPMHENWIIPKRMLQQRTSNMSSFRNDRLGAGIALNKVLLALVEAGVIEQLGPVQTAMYASRSAKLFVLTDREWVWLGETDEEKKAGKS